MRGKGRGFLLPKPDDSSDDSVKFEKAERGRLPVTANRNGCSNAVEELKGYNPMKEAYEDHKVNSYTSGPGQSLGTSQHVNKRRVNDNVKLHVANIPSRLDVKAVENIFNNYGDTSSVYVNPVASGSTWGFIEYSNLQEALRAISGLHNKPPYNLRVKFANVKEASVTEDDEDIPVPSKLDSSINRRPRPLYGIDPRKFRTLKKIVDDTKEVNNYQRNSYSIHTSPRSEELSNEMMEKFAEEQSHNGKVMRGGRSVHRSLPSHDSTPDKRATKDREKLKKEEDNSQPPAVFCPFKSGNCSQCLMATVSTCSVCKLWYCTYDCLLKDWDKHKLVCKPRSIFFSPNGELHIIENDETNDKSKKETESASINGKMTFDKDLPVVPRNISSHQAEINRNKEHEKNIIVRDLEVQRSVSQEKVSTSVSSRGKLKKEEPKGTLANPPIPRNTFTKCLVVFENSEEPCLYVTSLFDASDQDEMLRDLTEYYSKPRPNLTNISEGALCATQFIDQSWYRAVVVSVEKNDSARINFIDFGNCERVSVKNLYTLPEKFAKRAPMAFKITWDNDRKNFCINDVLEISPIKQMPDKSWLVRLEGDPEPQLTDDDVPSLEDDVDTAGDSQLSSCNQAFPLSKETFLEVIITYKEKDDLLWVVTEEGTTRLREMNDELLKYTSNKSKVTLKLHDIYNYKFEEFWCRALLTSLNPYTVFFVDYGNSMDVEPQDLIPLPLSLTSTPPLAIRIQLAKGTSSKYLNLREMEQLKVKAVESLTNKVLVIVEGEHYDSSVFSTTKNQPSQPPNTKKPAHALEYVKQDSNVHVIVVKGVGADHFCGALQVDNCNDIKTLSEISTALQAVDMDPKYKPTLNDDVVAKINSDSRLYRGYVSCIDDGVASVALTDCGRIVTPTALNLLPLHFKDLPSTAVRIVFSNLLEESPTTVVGSEITLRNVRVNDDMTVEADLGTYGRATFSPWVPLLEEIRIPSFPLENNCLATITVFYSPQTIYLRPLTPECIDVYNSIIQDVGAYGAKVAPLQRKPLCGELVCALWKTDGNFYRAVVSKTEKDQLKVNFLDFGNSELVDINDLRPLPDHFKKIPATCVKVGLKEVPGSVFNHRASKVISNLILSEKSLVATHTNDLRSVVLTEEASGDVINTLLAEAMKPSWVTTPDAIYTDNPFMADDVRYEIWKEGSKIEGVVVSVKDYNSFLYIHSSSTFEYINDVLTPEITKYCEQSSLKSYSPRVNEFILAKFEEDWYRAICLSKKINTDFASVFFVDYGNTGELSLDDIRNMPSEFVETPAAVKFCKIYGLPRAESITEENRKKLTALVESITEVVVVVEETKDGQNVVWAPSLEKHLEQMGLVYSKPVGFN